MQRQETETILSEHCLVSKHTTLPSNTDIKLRVIGQTKHDIHDGFSPIQLSADYCCLPNFTDHRQNTLCFSFDKYFRKKLKLH